MTKNQHINMSVPRGPYMRKPRDFIAPPDPPDDEPTPDLEDVGIPYTEQEKKRIMKEWYKRQRDRQESYNRRYRAYLAQMEASKEYRD